MRYIQAHCCHLQLKKTLLGSHHRLHTQVTSSKRQHGHWNDIQNQREYLESLAKELNLTHLDDWYSVSTDNIKKRGGKGLLKHFDVSLLNALRTVYPQHDWLPWKFNRVPQGYWKDLENQKAYLSWFTKHMGITNDSEWLRVKYSDLKDNHGYGLLECYGFSILNMLESVYPEKREYFRQLWMNAKIERQNELLVDPSLSQKQATAFPDGFWNNISNRRYLFDWIAQKLAVKSPSDWYRVTVTDVRKMGGASVLSFYNNSLYSALKSIYPEHSWMAWKFVQVPRSYWKDNKNTMQYLIYLSEQLNITRLEDWYNVSAYDVAALGGAWILKKHGGLIPLLAKFYPGFQWNVKAFRTKSKGQLLVTRYCKELFPSQVLETDFRHPKLFFAGTNHNMEFDIFFPHINLALEYQGEQHYLWSNLHGSPEHQQARDKEKLDACQNEGIRMVVVPFWWDRTKQSLQATIHHLYPDLIRAPPIGKPISLDMPMTPPSKSVVTSNIEFPDWQLWDESMNPKDMWITPTITGMSCFINQKKQCFLYGSSSPIQLPQNIAECIPSVAVEGTLMESTEGTQLAIYDVPSQRNLTYEDRQKFIQKNFGSSQHFILPQRTLCESQEQLRTLLVTYEEQSNGVLLTKPHSRYGEALSTFLLKSNLEEYASVVQHLGPTVICETRSGQKITLHTKHPLKVGDVITIEYLHKDVSGIPHQPRLVKINHNLKWEDLLSKKRSQGVAYHLTLGLRRGAPIPKCRVCGHVFVDRDEPRVVVKGAFIPPQNPQPHPVSFRLCATSKCIESAYKTLSENLSYGTWIPPFQKKLTVSREVHERLVALNRVPALGDVEWITSSGA